MTVKVRRVGNSNVVTLPRELEHIGYTNGANITVVPLETGEVLLVPAVRMEEYVQNLGRQILEQRRGAMEKLAAYDKNESA